MTTLQRAPRLIHAYIPMYTNIKNMKKKVTKENIFN